MAKYQLSLDRRTVIGRSVYNFLEELKFVNNDSFIDVDERNSFGRSLVKFLEDNNIIISKEEKIRKVVSKKFFEKRNKKGELSDKELMILNSRINASQYIAKKS